MATEPDPTHACQAVSERWDCCCRPLYVHGTDELLLEDVEVHGRAVADVDLSGMQVWLVEREGGGLVWAIVPTEESGWPLRMYESGAAVIPPARMPEQSIEVLRRYVDSELNRRVG